MITDPYTLYENYEVNPTSSTVGFVTIVTTATSVETFASTTKAIIIEAKTNSLYVELSTNGIDYGDKILVEASVWGGQSFTSSFKCASVRVSNVTTDGSHDGLYQAIGLW